MLQFTYDDMTMGGEALNSGNTLMAIVIFHGIVDTMGDETPAEVYQQLGICQRLVGNRMHDHGYHILANESFQVAYDLATTNLHRGQILRDWSMVAIEHRDYELANRRLASSYGLLHGGEELPAHPIEMAVTQGFLGRAYFMQGGRKNRRIARKLFKQADKKLYGIRPYELNNRAWTFKVARLWYRLWWAPRTLWLARQDRNNKRLLQVLLLVVCRPLALYLERRAEH